MKLTHVLLLGTSGGVILGTIGGAALLIGTAFAQQPAPAAAATAAQAVVVLMDSVNRLPDQQATVLTVTWPPGADTGRHMHPGDEYAVILEGSLQLTTEGAAGTQPTVKMYGPGTAYHNSRGVVHRTQNVGTVPAKTVSVFVSDKDMPRTIPVQ